MAVQLGWEIAPEWTEVARIPAVGAGHPAAVYVRRAGGVLPEYRVLSYGAHIDLIVTSGPDMAEFARRMAEAIASGALRKPPELGSRT